jgi:type II secretory pathway pseudopilin PulG
MTIVETLVAIVILAIGLLMLAGGSLVVTRNLTSSRLDMVANARAEAQLDELRAIAASTVPRCTSVDFATSAAPLTAGAITWSWRVEAAGRIAGEILTLTLPEAGLRSRHAQGGDRMLKRRGFTLIELVGSSCSLVGLMMALYVHAARHHGAGAAAVRKRRRAPASAIPLEFREILRHDGCGDIPDLEAIAAPDAFRAMRECERPVPFRGVMNSGFCGPVRSSSRAG